MSQVDVVLGMAGVRGVEVASCRLVEGISLITHATVQLAASDEVDLESAVSSDARLTFDFAGEERTFSLQVDAVRFTGLDDGEQRYEVELKAPLWQLQFTNDTRKYRNQTAEQIISSVLGRHGVAFEWKTTRKTRERQYCVQYHESDLAFVSRLLEFEGIYFTISDGGVVVFGDRSSAEPEVAGASHFELLDATGALRWDAPGVFGFRRGARVSTGKSTVNDFNWKTPKTKLVESESADLDAELEDYDYPVGFRNEGEGKLLAKLRLEAHRAGTEYVDGRGNVPAFAAARAFSFGADAGDEFAGDYLLMRVTHEFTRSGHTGEGATPTYQNAFRAIPRGVPFRPPVVTPQPMIDGDHTAMVRGPAGETIHTDEYGRMKAQFHWDREAKTTDDDSRWIRWLQETATSVSLARVGWEAVVAYINGDPDRPVGVGRHINGQMIPTYGQPSNKTMMSIKTPSYPGGVGYSEWRMNDVAGAQTIDIRAQRDLLTRVLHDRTELVDHDVTHTVLTNYQRAITKDQSIAIGSNSTTTVTAPMTTLVQGNSTTSIAGNETIKVDGGRVETVTGDDTENVGALRMTLDGSIQMPDLQSLATGALAAVGASVGASVGGVAGAAIAGAAKGASGGLTGALTGAIGGAGAAIGKDVGGPLGDAIAGAAGGASKGVDGIVAGAEKGLGQGVGAAIGGALPGGVGDLAGDAAALLGGGGSGGAGAGKAGASANPQQSFLDGLLSGLSKSTGSVPAGGDGGGGGGAGGPTPPIMGTPTGPSPQSFYGPMFNSPSAFPMPDGSTPVGATADAAAAAMVGGGSAAGGGGAGGAASAAGGVLGGAAGPMQAPKSVSDALTSALSPDKLLASVTNGAINRTTQESLTRMVGGAYVAVSLAPIQVTAAKAYFETIGGVKMTRSSEGEILTQVGAYLAVTVGGTSLRKAAGDITYSTQTSSVNVASIAALTSKKNFELLGTKITIDAKTSLTFGVGAASIELHPAAIKLKGKVALTSKDKINTTGKPVDLTAKG
jgi:type VI secretion system secreted protein VgrG